MQVLLLALVCASGARQVAGGAVAWPGAFPVAARVGSPYALAPDLQAVRTIVPAETRGFAYSNTQYINSLPTYYGLRPQVTYAPPQTLNSFAALQPAYYPVAGGSYYPPTSAIYYPSFAPVPQQPPATFSPSFPSEAPQQPSGDSDTAVVDSAVPSQPSSPSESSSDTSTVSDTPDPAASQPGSSPQFPPSSPSFPTFPQFPQFPQGSAPGFPSYPQFPPPGFPSAPQFPPSSQPGLPAFPQPSLPEFPGFPTEGSGPFPSFPSQFPNAPTNTQSTAAPLPDAPSSAGSFPSGDREDKGLNDEDTVSVESA